jgi:hypothetical protein
MAAEPCSRRFSPFRAPMHWSGSTNADSCHPMRLVALTRAGDRTAARNAVSRSRAPRLGATYRPPSSRARRASAPSPASVARGKGKRCPDHRGHAIPIGRSTTYHPRPAFRRAPETDLQATHRVCRRRMDHARSVLGPSLHSLRATRFRGRAHTRKQEAPRSAGFREQDRQDLIRRANHQVLAQH